MRLPSFTRRQKTFLAWTVVIIFVGAAVLFPITEYTSEFDGFNLRTRSCVRYRAMILQFVLYEHCSEPEDHPTAARLRQLGVLAPVNAEKSQWLLIKGFTAGIRGWHGQGKTYLRALGRYMALSPVPYPIADDLSQNNWVRWAAHNPEAARKFWRHFQFVATRTERAEGFLEVADIYFQKQAPTPPERVDLKEMETFIRNVMRDEMGVELPELD